MFPNPWANSAPPPVTKPIVNNYENNAHSYPFYNNAIQNITMSQQNSLSLNAASVMSQQNNLLNPTPIMTQSLQPNAIDPAMVQKWQEWKRWELWQQQFQQWQQQTGQITTANTQPAPPPMPPSQPLQTSQPSTISFQNQQYPYNQPRPPPPLPLTNQAQQISMSNEVGMKRGLESEFQNNEKKLKIDTVNSKKEIELNNETEALFEEQFKSWEEQFLKWKEQNKDHPDKTQYLEYEKKWLNWRDHLKQKCELLKKKRELKIAEKKKEAIQIEENKLQSQQRSGYNPMMSNITNLMNEPPPSTLQHVHNNSSMVPLSSSENQIPGLDLVSNNENLTKGFLNVTRLLPQNQNGPIQTSDDKPFNFPNSITNTTTINLNPVNIPLGNVNQLSTAMYQNPSSWSKYNNPVPYFNQKSPDIDNAPISRFVGGPDNSRQPYGGDISKTTYNNSQNSPNMNYRRPLEGSYNSPSIETKYNKPADDQTYNRNFNAPSNFCGYNQPKANTSNFNRPTEHSNIPYQQSKPSLNTIGPSKPPSLLSLNLAKPVSFDKPGNYSENKNDTQIRYERNWNITDEEDDPENEYMEAHKKFSSEPFEDQNDEDQFSNNQHRNMYNENHYSRGQQGARNLKDNYSRPLNQSRGSQMMRNADNEYPRSNSQFSKNVGQNYPCDIQTFNNDEDSYYKPQNNIRNMDQGFHREASFSKDIDEDYSNKHDIDGNDFASQKRNYGSSSRGNYGTSRGKFGNNTNRSNNEWDNDYNKNERLQQPVKDIIIPPLITIIKPPYEAQPIDPVKIFDYRHLPTLKVIPGLSKETVVPLRVYDYKHGGKRILPWQDRGYSRRNSNQTRDLNEKKGFIQEDIIDVDKSDEPLIESTFIDISSEEKDQNAVKIKPDEIEEIISTDVDTITIIDDDDDDNNNDDYIDEKKKIPEADIEFIDMCAPSPPKMSKIKETEKLCNRQLLTIETLLCPPGRPNRPSKIVIILRGLPGSGKSHVAKLIKEKEVAMGGQAPRILSLDDYFMTEITKTEIDPETNKMVEKKVMEYEHDSANESLYRTSFVKAFKKKILENYFSFYIIDAINNKVSYYKDILDISRINGFTVYVIELESDVDLCIKRNIHNRTAHDINSIMRSWVKTPDDQILLDIRSLLQSSSNNEMDMEDVSDVEMELDKDEETNVDDRKTEENKNVEFEEEDVMKLLSCKWTDTIPQEEKMKRLDGLCKKKTENSIKEWLQIPEDYTISEQIVVKDGKKRVRWADMEERREQEKMRAIGFVVGQTDWDRMLGRDQGESKLTQTKYI